ncbi:hypothetical protein NDU88_006271 [Pleurodeles waltl]|uniref:Uncharacterized protein n=1 Tax=Pleurodeles waltl TaxID=8319 RepID=A0AAV7X3Q1_PLEWA|nr:hypothetical protein NDU88_006271 [Pleurodeles waltl]
MMDSLTGISAEEKVAQAMRLLQEAGCLDLVAHRAWGLSVGRVSGCCSGGMDLFAAALVECSGYIEISDFCRSKVMMDSLTGISAEEKVAQAMRLLQEAGCLDLVAHRAWGLPVRRVSGCCSGGMDLFTAALVECSGYIGKWEGPLSHSESSTPGEQGGTCE